MGLFAAFGFLSKYLFIYLLASIDLLFIYLIFLKKDRKFDFKYLITLEVFLVTLVPHLIWLNNNEFITITYGLARTGLEQSNLIDHIKFPLIFLIKQIGLLIPFLILVWLLVQKMKFNFNLKDKKLLFLFVIKIINERVSLLIEFEKSSFKILTLRSVFTIGVFKRFTKSLFDKQSELIKSISS